MPSCDVVPDSTDLGTYRPNLRSITIVDDRFESIQMPSNVSWINISTHTIVDVDQENTKPCTSSSLKSALSMSTNSLCIQMFQRRLNTLFIASSERLWLQPTDLSQISQRQFLKRKRTSIESAIERSMIPLENHQICKRKSSGNCHECKEIGQLAESRKRRSLDEITPNLGRSKRGKRSTYGCNICDVSICKDGPCWAAYHHSIKIGWTIGVQGGIL